MSQRVQESVEVQAPAANVFRYWSNFENFSAFMYNVEEVRMTGTDTSHWKVKGPSARACSSRRRPRRWTRAGASAGTP